MRPDPISLYIHIPFCEAKCGYCDFFSVPRTEVELLKRYTDALIREIKERSPPFSDRQVGSIYFGGGTPSLLPPHLLARILAALRGRFSWESGTEITLEANPKTVFRDKLAAFRSLGVNRLSIGVQSFQDKYLKLLGRIHSADEARQTVQDAVAAGFENLSLDLIYALPGQTLQELEGDLKELSSWPLTHLSAYPLVIEEGTPLAANPPRLPEEGEQRGMFDRLRGGSGLLVPYEISNFALPGFECRHNLTYWNYGEYLGLGAGAVSTLRGGTVCETGGSGRAPARAQCNEHGWAEPESGPVSKTFGSRRQNVRDLKRYLSGDWEESTEEISHETARRERLMMGLRKREGVPLRFFESFPSTRSLVAEGWLEKNGDNLRLSRKGTPVMNEILLRLA